jgi:hypothetical protein
MKKYENVKISLRQVEELVEYIFLIKSKSQKDGIWTNQQD